MKDTENLLAYDRHDLPLAFGEQPFKGQMP